MGSAMRMLNMISISWSAGIVPSKELAGIPIGTSLGDFERSLSEYLVDAERRLYKFDGGPLLVMEKWFDPDGNGGLSFSVYDRDLTNWKFFFPSPDHAGADPRALNVIVKAGKVFAVKVWMFEKYEEGGRPLNSYKGKLPGGIGLGDKVSDILPYAELEFDDVEEWFYTDSEYGGLEVSGHGVELEEDPEQIIMALTVIKDSPFVRSSKDGGR